MTKRKKEKRDKEKICMRKRKKVNISKNKISSPVL
jgi:hypothetical protein